MIPAWSSVLAVVGCISVLNCGGSSAANVGPPANSPGEGAAAPNASTGAAALQSAPNAPVAEPTAVVVPANPRTCDALAFVSPPRVEGSDKPWAEVPGGPTLGNGDLDGDGGAEVSVVYNETPTTMATTILKKHDAGECFTVTYAGRGLISNVGTTRTNGWLDLELSVGARDPAKGFTLGGASVLATFDGSRYVWSRNLGCQYLEGKLPAKACEELVKKANPAGTNVPTK